MVWLRSNDTVPVPAKRCSVTFNWSCLWDEEERVTEPGAERQLDKVGDVARVEVRRAHRGGLVKPGIDEIGLRGYPGVGDVNLEKVVSPVARVADGESGSPLPLACTWLNWILPENGSASSLPVTGFVH